MKDLTKWGVLPANWNTNPVANLTAGGLFYAGMMTHYHLPSNEAAAGYHAGPKGYKGAEGQGYQSRFNAHKRNFTRLMNCFNSR